MSGKKILLIILAVIILGGLWGVISIKNAYNTLVGLDETTKTAWAQVETVLQRRFDLIPNLVATVQGFADQEKEVLTQVAEARASVGRAQNQSEGMQAQSRLTGALGRLMVVVERYPDLKSNQNFIRLQDELAGTENRISVERRRFNEAVDSYNRTMRSFPMVFFANMFNFEVKNRFEAAEGSDTAPVVDFNK
ncbi:MAG: LemA family protein [bacterium]|nr:LemA family protein [bacterium]